MFDDEAVRPLVMDVVRRHFRPEFLNRIDEIILFKRLGREQMDAIVGIQLKRVDKLWRPAAWPSRSIPPPCTGWSERGYDPVYGARPLKRVIQKDLIDPIARKLVTGEFADGARHPGGRGADGLEIGRATVN